MISRRVRFSWLPLPEGKCLPHLGAEAPLPLNASIRPMRLRMIPEFARPPRPQRPALLVGRELVPVVALVAVELAVGELGAGQQVLDELKGFCKLLVTLHHGAAIRLLELGVDGLFDQLPQEHEDHPRRCAIGNNLGLVGARGDVVGHGAYGVGVAGVSAMAAGVVMDGRSEGSLNILHHSLSLTRHGEGAARVVPWSATTAS